MKKVRNIKKNLPFIIIFLLGFLIFSYPYISQKYYDLSSNEEILTFNKERKKIDDKSLRRRIQLARAYNRTLDPSKIGDPFDKIEVEGRKEYARMLEIHEMIGYVEIPKVAVKLPIYAGTSSQVLESGAGHLEGTSLPVGGKSTHTVITAHRGLPRAKMFRNIDELTFGDIFYIHNLEKTLAYKVDQIETVDPSDFSKILVEENEDFTTLLTCTPYMINSHRLLVRGHRIPYQEAIDDGMANMRVFKPDFFKLFLFSIPIIILLFAIYQKERKRTKIIKKEVTEIEKRENKH